jgi:propanol-preferring alcohol dehydrogenase
MVVNGIGAPLQQAELPHRQPSEGQLRLKVHACGVCRTDLHIVGGELTQPKLPLVLGHQIFGTVLEPGRGVTRFRPGQRVGVPWLGWTCGRCRFCASGRENLCDRARFTGYTIDGGPAEETLADARSWFMVPEGYPDLQAAPLLCAGLIGYRSLRLTGDATLLGLYGFGPRSTASARSPAGRADACLPSPVPGDSQGQAFARSLGAEAAPGRRVPVEGRHGEQCSPTRR